MPDPQDAQLSHTSGRTDVPLLEQTIGDNLDATVARFPDREALVDVAEGIRWTYRRVRGPRSTGSRAPCWPRAWARATGSASGRRTAPSGR